MLIVCPNCATSYDVDTASLRPEGRRVRCLRCRSVWQAELPHSEKLVAAAEALAPVRRTVEAMAEVVAETEAVPEAEAEPLDPVGEVDPVPEPEPMMRPEYSATATELAVTAEIPSFEADSPPIAPAEAGGDGVATVAEVALSAPAPEEDKPLEDVETAAARRYAARHKRRRWQWPLSRLQSGILALIVADAIVVGWRADFVRAMPQTASFYAWIGLPVNLRGLDLDELTTSTEQHDGVPILLVGGEIVNGTGRPEAVPHLRFAVRNAARQEIYSWTAPPPQAVLPSGQAVAFRTRLASPPPDSHDVLVRFVNRYDILTGTH